MVYHTFNDNNHFGATLTPLIDSTLLVCKVVDSHPLGLELGDRILGYEGRPWKTLYRVLLSNELPITNINAAATPQSAYHMWMSAAGENWHLFDTIDIIKHGSGDTLNLSTSLLMGQEPLFPLNEQLPVTGVPFPNLNKDGDISWGIIENANIGYIYTYNWPWNSNRFEDAVKELMYDKKTDGLIIDTRFDLGGYAAPVVKGLRHLFNTDLYVLVDVFRNNPDDRFGLKPFPVDWKYGPGINATNEIYDKPIAVLTGPKSVSQGDVFPLILSYHPYVRTFGKQTNGAFSGFWESYADSTLVHGWKILYPDINSYLVDQPKMYLSHAAPPVDEEIWLEPDAVARGEDNVVSRAVEWIQNKVYPYSASLPVYAAPGSQIPVTVNLQNPNDHLVSLWSYLRSSSSNTLLDSVQLMASDSNAYTGNLEIPSLEDNYFLAIKSRDMDDIDIQELPLHITSIGPVEIDHYEITNKYTVMFRGETIELKNYLINNSRDSVISKIEIELVQIDSCVTPLNSYILLPIDTLQAGEVKTHAGSFYVRLEMKCTDKDSFPVQLNIYADKHLRWIDTLYIDTAFNMPDTTAVSVSRYHRHEASFYIRNYPNPFRQSTSFELAIQKPEFISLKIYNTLGQEVETLIHGNLTVGNHRFEWRPASLSGGIYFYRIQSGEYVKTKKLIFNK